MVRTNRPLVERMTLVWHDWFATSNEGVGSQRLMIGQNRLFRNNAMGSFAKLLLNVTRDPAMLVWLSGVDNTKNAPNENYGRELMELFTLGAGRGYTENDVREQARALTGFRDEWDENLGPINFHFDAEYHDGGMKRILGKRGTVRLARRLPAVPHPPEPSLLLRAEAVVLLRADAARQAHGPRAGARVRAGQLRRAPDRRGDPPPPRPLPRAAHGEGPVGLRGGPVARHGTRRRHRRLDLDRPPDGPAPVQPSERGRAGTTPGGSTAAPGAAAGTPPPKPSRTAASTRTTHTRPTIRRRPSIARSRSGATRPSRRERVPA